MTEENIEQDVPRPPEDFFNARREAFDSANWQCTVRQDGCLDTAVFAHQKKLIIGEMDENYERKIDGVMQTADNLVVCCQVCHVWIHNNHEEATALGYLDRD
jgi:hypothetical protein